MIDCFYFNSARSKVRGTLEIYHAYIRDLDSNGSNAADPDWEIVDNESTTSVSVTINYYLFTRYEFL